jgi:nuclear pore complex protein Nup160
VAKRRRVSSYIPVEEWSKDNRAIDIVTLADMREEYALVLAQLKLAGQVDDFHLHGGSLWRFLLEVG